MVSLNLSRPIKKKCGIKKPTRFEEGWTLFSERSDIIKVQWEETPGVSPQTLTRKVSMCLEKLSKWNKNKLKGSLSVAIANKEEEIKSLPRLQGGITPQS